MARCISSYCRHKIDPQWHFCPYCGTDNRPPAERIDVPEHKHRFLHFSGCCIYCGEPRDEPYEMPRRQRVGSSAVFGILGLTCGLAGGWIYLVRKTGQGPLSDWIASWYHKPITYASGSGGLHTSALGDSLLFWFGLGCVLFSLASVWLFFKLPIPEQTRPEIWHEENPLEKMLFRDRRRHWPW